MSNVDGVPVTIVTKTKVFYVGCGDWPPGIEWEFQVFGKIFAAMGASLAVQYAVKAIRDLPAVIQPFPFDIEGLVGRIVTETVASKPALFEGRAGKKPTAISTAVVSLAAVLLDTEDSQYIAAQPFVSLALGNMLLDCANNYRKYGFCENDRRLLMISEKTYMAYMARTEAGREAVIGGIL